MGGACCSGGTVQEGTGGVGPQGLIGQAQASLTMGEAIGF